MSAGKFRKKPVVIEAVQFTLDSVTEAVEFLGRGYDALSRDKAQLNIETPEGTMVADLGDWIIKGVNGEFYPCKPDIFEATYDPVEA